MVVTGVLLGLFVLGGCGGKEESAPTGFGDDRMVAAAVNYPLAYFAERIGAEHVKVVYPVDRDVDPAFWSPGADEVALFQGAELILLNGADYAKWVPKVTLPAGKLVNTSAAFADGYITVAEATTHAHGPGGEHAHTGTAFTTWLDFTQAAAQARAIHDAFAAARPAHTEAFKTNFAALEADLSALDRELAAMTAGKNDRPLVASHPVYQYLARRYGLNLVAVMWEPETVPQPSQWRELETILADHPAHWMIWEGPPAAESFRRLEQMGVGSVVFAPGMNRPERGDFLDVMRTNLANLAVAFE
jgi:zinc transport system substrate-binding protein